jgi:hypothetical protein
MKLHGFIALASSHASAKPAEAYPPSPLASEGYPFRIAYSAEAASAAKAGHPRVYTRGFLRRRVKRQIEEEG